jgi:uncharacterized Tic20 family protein
MFRCDFNFRLQPGRVATLRLFFLNPNPNSTASIYYNYMENSPPPLPAGMPVGPAEFPSVRTWNILCHATALLGVLLHFPGHILGPLIVWLAKRHDSPEIDAHGKESLNFQISMLLYTAIAAVFCLVLIGFLVLPILWVLNAVFVVVASIQASDGKLYRYPMTIRFIE